MQANSYENTLAFVHALNRKSRKHSVLQQIVSLFVTIAQGVRLAGQYEELTRQGMPPEQAVRRVFEVRDR